MKTVPPEVKSALSDMENVIGTINAQVCTLKIMQAQLAASIAPDDREALYWVVHALSTEVRDLDRQWRALFEMTRETGGGGTPAGTAIPLKRGTKPAGLAQCLSRKRHRSGTGL